MKIITYNINGIRAAMKKGFVEWLAAENPDVICLQEVKALEEQADLEEIKALGYHIYWHAAEKKGYSGVAVFSKVVPQSVSVGIGIEKYDQEGRLHKFNFGDFSLINSYFPSGSSGDERQAFKYEYLDDFYAYIEELKNTEPNLVICGDVNICHKAIDIHNPKTNKNTSGFLPEEREWVTKFLASGFVDCFRQFDESPDHYSWWSYRGGARARNKGWRIDYFFASTSLTDKLKGCKIMPEVKHSDHCPVCLEIEGKP
ncbi:MAG: exodeoxyribonuclease III [Flammeovirgaceae bacterium]